MENRRCCFRFAGRLKTTSCANSDAHSLAAVKSPSVPPINSCRPFARRISQALLKRFMTFAVFTMRNQVDLPYQLNHFAPVKNSGVMILVAAQVAVSNILAAEGMDTNALTASVPESLTNTAPQNWNFHVQNTDIVQGYPGFSAKYSGPNSLPAGGETRETVSLDLLAGVRLWPGAEAHIDGLMWQGYGLGNALGVDGFPNGEAFRLGTGVPNGAITRLFIRQTIGLGGEQETIEDDQLTLAGKTDVSRLTFTIGRFSAKDIFDNNAYANDPRTQFMNWALMANEAWDYPADAIGYTTGLAAELNQPDWTLRYGLFQMPRYSNSLTAEDRIFKWPFDGSAQDGPVLDAWGMVTEFERRFRLNTHPGVIRFLAYVNRSHMGNYQDAVNSCKRRLKSAAGGARKVLHPPGKEDWI